jgi:Cytochrome b5-like Heme/Steroid binding domain
MDFFSGVKKFLGLEEGPHFSKAEIARHHNRDSLWIVADGTVYDVTQFVDQHAGGVTSLIKRGGGVQDCARDFSFHSSKAQSLWKSFEIGYVCSSNSQKTDEAGRNYLRSRGIIPVEDLLSKGRGAERVVHCVGNHCTFHFEENNKTNNNSDGSPKTVSVGAAVDKNNNTTTKTNANTNTTTTSANVGKAPLQT